MGLPTRRQPRWSTTKDNANANSVGGSGGGDNNAGLNSTDKQQTRRLDIAYNESTNTIIIVPEYHGGGGDGDHGIYHRWEFDDDKILQHVLVI